MVQFAHYSNNRTRDEQQKTKKNTDKTPTIEDRQPSFRRLGPEAMSSPPNQQPDGAPQGQRLGGLAVRPSREDDGTYFTHLIRTSRIPQDPSAQEGQTQPFRTRWNGWTRRLADGDISGHAVDPSPILTKSTTGTMMGHRIKNDTKPTARPYETPPPHHQPPKHQETTTTQEEMLAAQAQLLIAGRPARLMGRNTHLNPGRGRRVPAADVAGAGPWPHHYPRTSPSARPFLPAGAQGAAALRVRPTARGVEFGFWTEKQLNSTSRRRTPTPTS